ncbi:alpha/beta hydrolase [Pseudogulbenkiania sp. MAI-1]|uniref:alpha/beta hydrolase n=1 Tax=Pseudogulbenkiania sp. MAI-1 TaxID=990370 RepID=UPI00045E8237|nr:alpha/beta hydrolase [Pseudogulbenkiania sp. MAI-1]
MKHPRLELIHEAARGVALDAPPLLFVHGAFTAAWCWQQHFLPWFAERGYDCWALSLEGHGESSGHDYLSGISIDDYVRNLSAVIRQIGHTPIVIGHSMGGFVLQQYLTLHTLPGAVLLASVPPHGLAGSSLRLLAQAPSQLLALNLYQNGMHRPDWTELRDMLFSATASEEVVALMARRAQQESQRAIMDMTLVNPLFIRPLPPLPALVLGAAGDHLISAADVVATADRLDCSAEILPHMGHMMMLDSHWEKVAERMLEWLEQHWPNVSGVTRGALGMIP